MTRDEARDLFSEYYDGVLDPLRSARLEALFETDAELSDEYDSFVAVLEAAVHAEADVDLVAGVQERLRVRSKGRFYSNRFAEGRGSHALTAIASVLTLLTIGVVCAYFILSATVLPR